MYFDQIRINSKFVIFQLILYLGSTINATRTDKTALLISLTCIVHRQKITANYRELKRNLNLFFGSPEKCLFFELHTTILIYMCYMIISNVQEQHSTSFGRPSKEFDRCSQIQNVETLSLFFINGQLRNLVLQFNKNLCNLGIGMLS